MSRFLGQKPQITFILGSGLGDLVEKITDETLIDYADLPDFPVSTVHGYAVICMKGRGHFYEGLGLTIMTTPCSSKDNRIVTELEE